MRPLACGRYCTLAAVLNLTLFPMLPLLTLPPAHDPQARPSACWTRCASSRPCGS